MSKFLRGLEIRHLAVLQAIAETGSFWSAADRLDLSPSAVSQQVATLEGVTGERLLERSRGRRSVKLTPAGRLLLRHADVILARVRAAETDLTAFRNGTKGWLRIGTYQSIGARILPRLLPQFAAEWPDVEVRLIEGLSDAQLLAMVETGELDVTFTTFPTRPGPFESMKLLEDPYVLATARHSTFDYSHRNVSLRSLGDLRLLGIATCRAEICERFRTLGLDPAIWFASADNAVVQGLVAAGVGAAIVPMLTVDHADERIRLLPIVDFPPRRLGLVWHADRYYSSAVAAFKKAAVALCMDLESEFDAIVRRGLPRVRRKADDVGSEH
jgi:molybdate transport repressor ModE-like protein